MTRIVMTASLLIALSVALASPAAAQARVGGILNGVADIVDAAQGRPPVYYQGAPPVVAYPVPVAVPAYPAFKRPAVIYIVNPITNRAPVSYTLDGYPYVTPPGYVQTLSETYVIQFDRGLGFGIARYGLTDGTFTFTPTAAGTWELFHSP